MSITWELYCVLEYVFTDCWVTQCLSILKRFKGLCENMWNTNPERGGDDDVTCTTIVSVVKFVIIFLIQMCVTFFCHAWGEECANLTQADCKIHQQLVTVNNCSRCICGAEYFHHHGLGGCKPCHQCTFPKAIIKNCTQTSDTECGLCPKVN